LDGNDYEESLAELQDLIFNSFTISSVKLFLTVHSYLQDFILEHYSEDGNDYEESLAELQELCQP
jgi:hypothetical protein